MNINHNIEDTDYRYKMPELEVRLAGRGNGSYTILDNIDRVSESLCTPTIILLNFIARSIGSSSNENKKTITGHYNVEQLTKHIYNYIDYFVLCNKCTIPELIPTIIGKKKRKKLQMTCSACGKNTILESSAKLHNKTIEHMIKYYTKNKYTISKGNIVVKEENDMDSFNPF